MKTERLTGLAIAVLLAAFVASWLLFWKDGDTETVLPSPPVETIRILSCYEFREEKELLESLARRFEQNHPELQVEVIFVDRENLKKTVCLYMEEGMQPDILICDSMEMPGFMDMGILEDLTEVVETGWGRNSVYPKMWQSLMDDGRYYGVPFTLNPYVLFVNMDYLLEQDAPVPENWEMVFDLCRKNDGGGMYGLGMGVGRSGDGAQVFNQFLHVCGGDYYSLDKEAGIHTLTMLDELRRWNYVDKNSVNATPKDAAEDFAEGRLIMLLAPLDTRVWLEHQTECVAYKMTAVPGDVRDGLVLSGDSVGIKKGADEKTREFLRFLYQEEIRKEILEKTGTFPILQQEYRDSMFSDDLAALNEEFLLKGVPLRHYGSWFEISGILSSCMRKLLVVKTDNLQEMAVALQDEMRVAIMNN